MKPINMKQDTRQYGFMDVPERFAEDVTSALCLSKLLIDDNEAREMLDDILTSLFDPENSRVTSPTDNNDALEEYFINRVSCYGIELHEDIVYKFLFAFKEFFEGRGAYEMCHNIRKTLEILDKWQNGLSNADIDLGF